MKKLIIILLLMPICLNAQIKQDKINHFSAGFLISGIGNITTYELIQNTDIKPFWTKAISFTVGAGLGVLAGHAKEKYDLRNGGYYSKMDLESTMYGSLTGSFTIRLVLWNSIPKSHVPIKDIFDIENDELLSKKVVNSGM